MNEDLLDSFVDYIEDLGGDVAYADGFGLLNAPFSSDVGMNWDAKLVFLRNECRNSVQTIVYGIHEAGHIFCTTEKPTLRIDEDETYFLGWEYLFAKKLELSDEEWLDSNADYGVNGVIPDREGDFIISDIGGIPENRVQEFLDKIVSISRSKNILKGMLPISLRTDNGKTR